MYFFQDGVENGYHYLFLIIIVLTKKALNNVFQLNLVGLSVLYNILNVYQYRTTKNVIFSIWRPKWLRKSYNNRNDVGQLIVTKGILTDAGRIQCTLYYTKSLSK